MKKKSDDIKLRIINPLDASTNFIVRIEGDVVAGFPSPANDYIEKELNFKELFIRNESATFFVRVVGDSMIDAGIFDGDILVVDRSLNPRHNSILVCYIDGKFTVKKVEKIEGSLYLVPGNTRFKALKIDEYSDFRVWGVVTFAIHKFR